MDTRNRWAFALAATGLLGLVAAMLDPLEGSVVAVVASALLAVGARIGYSQFRRPLYLTFGMITLGVAVMFGFSSMGGIGGNSGRSIWLGLLILPYPIGWVMGLVFGVKFVRVARAT